MPWDVRNEACITAIILAALDRGNPQPANRSGWASAAWKAARAERDSSPGQSQRFYPSESILTTGPGGNGARDSGGPATYMPMRIREPSLLLGGPELPVQRGRWSVLSKRLKTPAAASYRRGIVFLLATHVSSGGALSVGPGGPRAGCRAAIRAATPGWN